MSVDLDIQRIDTRHELDFCTGSACEACGLPVPIHDWVDMDRYGYIHNCSMMED